MLPDDFRVGYAQRIITPSLDYPVYLAGFGPNRVAQSVHDALYARALALSLCETKIVLVALDLLGLTRDHCMEIEARVNLHQPEAQLIIACTHVHHGPDTIGMWGPDIVTSGVNADYLTGVKNTVCEIVLEALNTLQLVQMRTASVQVPGVARNNRNPDIRDEELTCVQFGDPETGKPLATWLVFPCHPEVLWDNNPHITSDYIHTLRETIEAATDAPALFMVGALGGLMTPDVQRHDFEEASAMGETLAQAGLTVLAETSFKPVNYLTCVRKVFKIPLQSFLFEEAMRVGPLPNIRDTDGNVTTETGLLKIGSAWFATVPGELLPRLGLVLKSEMRAAGADLSAVIGLANDEIAYILPRDEYIYPENPFEPGNHYEETMSIGPETAPRLMDALRTLMNSSI
jgi:hypothetical protein